MGSRVEEESAVRAVLEQVFRGMREADSAMVRAAFHAGARFASARDGGIRYDEVDGWIRAVATSGGRWDERIYDVEVDVDPPVASAWVPYTFYLDGEISHCGANTVELLRTAAGWKITQLSDSRRREGCPDPRAAPGGDDVLVFQDVTVLPMVAERVVPGQAVIVRGDRLEGVATGSNTRASSWEQRSTLKRPTGLRLSSGDPC
ncbi:MAG: nuclear transport factor 2 family protein [Gemmatimonadetes bacterium]|nr:nuclear transport factor 2 family protein [Gemmatimonadota bacterium]